jgi:hypothetical protein
MKLNHDPGETVPVAHEEQIEEGEDTEPALKRVNLTAQPISPKFNTNSVDQVNGFMDYSSPITNGLRNAHINLPRFPGVGWGEEHLLSYDQLNAFSVLLSKLGADGMIQARLPGPIGKGLNNLESLINRAHLAGRWVDYMNNPHSDQRTGNYAHAPFHPIKCWTVGNEPDRLINPDTGKPFTVADYTNAFIQFSLIMHRIDPTIQVFGPEISQFYGLGIGPKDSNGQLWMESFLKGVAAYESIKMRTGSLLGGVSQPCIRTPQ